jgi:hypothetical protein
MAARLGEIIYWAATAFAVICVVATIGTYIYWIVAGLPETVATGEGANFGPGFMWLGALEPVFVAFAAYTTGRGLRLGLAGY